MSHRETERHLKAFFFFSVCLSDPRPTRTQVKRMRTSVFLLHLAFFAVFLSLLFFPVPCFPFILFFKTCFIGRDQANVSVLFFFFFLPFFFFFSFHFSPFSSFFFSFLSFFSVISSFFSFFLFFLAVLSFYI